MTLQTDPERNESKYLHAFVDFAGKRVLELGCGEGRLTWSYARTTHITVAIDPDLNALRVANVDKPHDLQKKVHFARTVSENLPFSRETFDLAIFAWSF